MPSLAVVAGGLAACALPTDLCGCSPARSVVYVLGGVRDAGGTPLAGARVYLEGASAPVAALGPQIVAGPGDAVTDGAGEFRAPAYSMAPPGVLELRAAVVRAAGADTVRLSAGPTSFRHDRERPDTVRVLLRVP